MKRFFTVFFFAIIMSFAALAYAGSDDAKWIAQCLEDNKNAKVPTEVIVKYCTCMNNKMDENEELTITQWEKQHPKEQEECDKVAGWK